MVNKLYDVIRKEEKDNPKWKEKAPLPPKHFEVEDEIPEKKSGSHWKRTIIYAGALVFLAALYLLGVRYVNAKVVITERRIPVTLNNLDLELVHENNATDGTLSYQSMVVSTTISREVYGSGLTQSNTKATGSVVFFNEYSKTKQTIRKGTTLTATTGKRYTTLEAATVAGYTISGKKKTAGTSPQVKIQAVQTGDAYNTDGASFTVAGWNSKSIYARSATPISGGDAGVAHILTDAEKSDALLTLQTQLVERLKRESRAQIPDDLITFPDLQAPIVDEDSLVLQGSGIRFPAKLSGSMVTYLVSRKLLEQAIASKGITDNKYTAVTVPDISGLTVELLSPVPTDTKTVPETISIRVSGTATVIAKIPAEKMKEALLGKKRADFNVILGGFPEAASAKVHFYPFWSPIFPSNEQRIVIQSV